MFQPPLISVILPVFNGAATIGETIESVQRQTHESLEIIVVDDGSTDATPTIVSDRARTDPRIKLIRQDNGGVAAARNRAIAEAVGTLIAPIDADDLWDPEKLAKQWRALERGGEHTSLVYTWSADVDTQGVLIRAIPGPMHEGDVLPAICSGNFIGNASAVLMRKAAVIEAGGFDASLRARSAQGCEDFLLYYRIARRGHFAVVPEFLTKYRWRQTSMSSDTRQMLRSWRIVAQEICRDYPVYRANVHGDLVNLLKWLYCRTAPGQIGDRLYVVARMAIVRPRSALAFLLHRSGRAAPRWWANAG